MANATEVAPADTISTQHGRDAVDRSVDRGEAARMPFDNTQPRGAAEMEGDPEIAWRVEALRTRLPPDGSVPAELSVLGLEPEAGRCPSCGEGQPYGQFGKCTLCCLASVEVLRGLAGDRPGFVSPEGVA
jgi:hypothetical protein